MVLCSAHFNSWINMSIVNKGNILSAAVFRQFDNFKNWQRHYCIMLTLRIKKIEFEKQQ